MPKRLIPQMTNEQKTELEDVLCHSTKPYLRERASAILKLAQAQTVSDIAASGLLRKRHRETVSDWFYRFQSDGIKGLEIKAGRGRKPAFFPSTDSSASHRATPPSGRSTARSLWTKRCPVDYSDFAKIAFLVSRLNFIRSLATSETSQANSQTRSLESSLARPPIS